MRGKSGRHFHLGFSIQNVPQSAFTVLKVHVPYQETLTWQWAALDAATRQSIREFVFNVVANKQSGISGYVWTVDGGLALSTAFIFGPKVED
jgi:hypothetical protein